MLAALARMGDGMRVDPGRVLELLRAFNLRVSKLVLGKHSGRHALRDRLSQLGYTVDEPTLNAVYDKFKALADKKKDVYDEDIEALKRAYKTVNGHDIPGVDLPSRS